MKCLNCKTLRQEKRKILIEFGLVVFSKHISQKVYRYLSICLLFESIIFKGYSCLYKPTKNHINWKLVFSKGFKTIFTIFVLERGGWPKEQELRKNWESVFVSVVSVRRQMSRVFFSKENHAFRFKVFVLLQIPPSLPRSITATPHLSRSVLCSFVRKKSVQF